MFKNFSVCFNTSVCTFEYASAAFTICDGAYRSPFFLASDGSFVLRKRADIAVEVSQFQS